MCENWQVMFVGENKKEAEFNLLHSYSNFSSFFPEFNLQVIKCFEIGLNNEKKIDCKLKYHRSFKR